MLLLLLLSAFEIDPAVEKARNEWGAQGIAIAVVRDGKIVRTKGYGVDAHTVFQFGSLTKGFTAATIASLVEDKKLAFDDPVVKHLQSFTLADPALAKELTLRDLLAHRTGLQPEVDWLWAAGKDGLTRAALLDRLRFAHGATPLRDGFTYHNVTYAVLGEVIAKASGKPWEQAMRERVFTPAGMSDASLGAAAFAAAKNVARPHDDDGKIIEALSGDAVGPAAAANGSISDLAAYLLYLLSAPKALEPVVSPQNLMPLGAYSRKIFEHSHLREYGMGWVLQDHRGKLVVWNTGGMTGDSCSIAFLPEEKLGIAVLTNQPRTSLPEALVFELIDRALAVEHKDWSAVRLAISKENRPKPPPPAPKATDVSGRYAQPLLGEVTINKGVVRFVGATGDLERTTDGLRVAWRNKGWGTSKLTLKDDALELEEAGTFTRVKQ